MSKSGYFSGGGWCSFFLKITCFQFQVTLFFPADSQFWKSALVGEFAVTTGHREIRTSEDGLVGRYEQWSAALN
jgi:hypothetical protein